MGEACRAFGIPVVGGNVSLYNESGGQDIDPTPVVGLVGLVDRLDQRPPGVRLVEGGTLLALGPEPRSLSGSRWAWERGSPGRPGPELDLEAHAAVADLVRNLVAEGLLVRGARHRRRPRRRAGRDGGAVGQGLPGPGRRAPTTRWLFAESASRVVACVTNGHADDVVRAAQSAGVRAATLGRVGGDRLVVSGLLDVSVDDATRRLARAIFRTRSAIGRGALSRVAARWRSAAVRPGRLSPCPPATISTTAPSTTVPRRPAASSASTPPVSPSPT